MSGLVLILAFISIFLIWRLTDYGWREAFLFAVIVWSLILVAMTETFSAFHLLTYRYVLSGWLTVGLLAGAVFYIKRNKSSAVLSRKNELPDLIIFKKYDQWLIACLILMIVLIGFTGLAFEPNSYDSMQYHLPRIMHWIQNRDVGHFPTTTLRELVMSPGSEFAMLHIILLTQSDRLAFLVQWFSMVGSVIVATLLAQRLGAGVTGQILAAIVSVSIPVGILEASATLNDYYVAFWILCFTYFSLEIVTGNLGFLNKFGFGASLGLAVLAKSTAYLYALPILIWVGGYLILRQRKEIISIAILTSILTISINFGYLTRNYLVFSNPLGPYSETREYPNEIYTPAAIISNFVRNISLHFSTPVGRVNSWIEQQVGSIHSTIGMDVNDPRTTFEVYLPEFQYRLSTSIRHELYASNLVHLFMIVLFSAMFFLQKNARLTPQKNLKAGYFWIGVSMFTLFCVLLKWQPIHSRQHLPFFLHFAPFIAIVIEERFKLSSQFVVAMGLLILSLPWVLFNQMRPLIAIQDAKSILNSLRGTDTAKLSDQAERYGFFSAGDVQLFHEIPTLRAPLMSAIDYLADSSSCREFGFVAGDTDIEYPVWKLLDRKFADGFKFKHVLVENGSEYAINNHPDFVPCILVSLSSHLDKSLDVNHEIYLQKYVAPAPDNGSCCTVSIYEKK